MVLTLLSAVIVLCALSSYMQHRKGTPLNRVLFSLASVLPPVITFCFGILSGFIMATTLFVVAQIWWRKDRTIPTSSHAVNFQWGAMMFCITVMANVLTIPFGYVAGFVPMAHKVVSQVASIESTSPEQRAELRREAWMANHILPEYRTTQMGRSGLYLINHGAVALDTFKKEMEESSKIGELSMAVWEASRIVQEYDQAVPPSGYNHTDKTFASYQDFLQDKARELNGRYSELLETPPVEINTASLKAQFSRPRWKAILLGPGSRHN